MKVPSVWCFEIHSSENVLTEHKVTVCWLPIKLTRKRAVHCLISAQTLLRSHFILSNSSPKNKHAFIIYSWSFFRNAYDFFSSIEMMLNRMFKLFFCIMKVNGTKNTLLSEIQHENCSDNVSDITGWHIGACIFNQVI